MTKRKTRKPRKPRDMTLDPSNWAELIEDDSGERNGYWIQISADMFGPSHARRLRDWLDRAIKWMGEQP